MSKFGGAASVRAAQEGKLAELTLPTGEPQAAAPTPQGEPASPQPSGLMQELQAYQPSTEQELQAEVDTQAAVGEALPELQAEVDRQSIPSLAERGRDTSVQRWAPGKPARTTTSNTSQSPDGGLRARAANFSNNVQSGKLALGLSAAGTPGFALEKAGAPQPDIASAISEQRTGDLYAAMARVNALETNPSTGKQAPNKMYTQVAAAVVENEMANILSSQKKDKKKKGGEDPLFSQQTDPSDEISVGPDDPTVGQPTHAQSNSQLGQSIHQEYQRMTGNKVPEKLPREEAESLGAAFKHMWAENNPELVTRVIDPKTQQWTYQFSAQGEKAIRDGEETRKRLFPTVRIKPAKQPLPTGKLPGDVGQNVARKVSGGVGDQKFGKTIEQAMVNMAQIPNVVDKQRAKILLSTILPVLKDGSHDSWQAEINNFGPGKLQKFAAAKEQQVKRMEEAQRNNEEFDEEIYSPEENMAALVDKIAQEVRAVAQERNGANYLSYNVQGFQGRITPQQAFFNPTRSKAVRFVTRNATPSIAKPGSRVEANLRQMYAMMILPKSLKADVDLPPIREQKLTANSAKLEAWGDRLAEAMTMTDEQYEAVSDAISNGMSLNDPNFPQYGGLELDPQKDAELIKHIESKGEDGPHVMDGLMDFAKYMKAKRAGRPYNSFFNAYMDGKTNGLASNGIQMGHIDTAARTGVLRDQRKTLLDGGNDIRDDLQTIAVDSIKEGWDGNTDGFQSELDDIAETVFSHRDLNKLTTMTFGYGKEIDSFTADVEEAIAFLNEAAKEGSSYPVSLSVLDQHMSRNELAKTLMNKYEPALRQVMSDEALEARALMRSAAAIHAATNQLMSIKGPTGMDLNIGGEMSTGYDAATKTSYKLYGEGGVQETQIAHYGKEATSAAERGEGDFGGKAYGGSVVAPVQAVDAATVALTATGKSWDRLSKASGGNPYMHTIYDAFKVDANGYDVVLEEVNKNWLNASMNWSYLEQTYKATKESLAKFNEEMKKRDPKEPLTDNESAYMKMMLTMEEAKSGRKFLKGLTSKMTKLTEKSFDMNWEFQEKMQKEMKKVGYDVNNPPETPNVAQLKTFVKVLSTELNLGSRLSRAINQTNANKKKLKQEILKKGYKTPSGERIALQYYAH